MSDLRTDEQKAASRNLDDAIIRLNAAYDEPGMLVDWVVAQARLVLVDDESANVVDVISSEQMPVYHRIGLMQSALRMLEQELLYGEE